MASAAAASAAQSSEQAASPRAEPSITSQEHVELEWARSGESHAVLKTTEKELEEKERRLQESIARNYGKIREVEAELQALQVQLRVNVGPRKQALELLRRKIEAQNERMQVVRDARNAAAKALAAADAALAAEEQKKARLCSELEVLVRQGTQGQLDKLESLANRLEQLNGGLAVAPAAAAHAAQAAAPGPAQRAAAAGAAQVVAAGAPSPEQQAAAPRGEPDGVDGQPAVAAAPSGGAGTVQGRASHFAQNGAAPGAGARPERQQGGVGRPAEAQQRAAADAQAAAAAARARHVQLPRRAGPPGAPSALRPQQDARGSFSGFG